MARAALAWSRADLARAAKIGTATVVRFEEGKNVSPEKCHEMRAALEAEGVRFVDEGPLAGAVHAGAREVPRN